MKASTIIFSLVIVIFCASCGDMKEEITFNKDGSGSYEFTMDIIPAMKSMMMSMSALDPANEDLDSLELEKKIDEMIWKDFPDHMDSVIDYSSQLPPEVKGDPEKMAVLENIEAFMKGGKEAGAVLGGIRYDFNSIDQFLEIQDALAESSKNNQKAKDLPTESKYTLSKKMFIRTSKVPPRDKTNEAMALLGNEAIDMSLYTTINFERKIKSVKVTGYEVIEQSDYSVTIKQDLGEAIKNGMDAEIKIALK